jgi:hypothetical protein
VGPLYIVTERFSPANCGTAWKGYLQWSNLHQLTELVSLDSMLCKPVIRELVDEDWAHIVNEDFMLSYFTDVEYLVRRAGHLRDRNLLCVYRNPATHPAGPVAASFHFGFEGYDLVEVGGGPSALTNCGGFPNAFSNEELSPHGLLPSLDRAAEVQEALRRHYPDEPHACCDLWAIFRTGAA